MSKNSLIAGALFALYKRSLTHAYASFRMNQLQKQRQRMIQKYVEHFEGQLKDKGGKIVSTIAIILSCRKGLSKKDIEAIVDGIVDSDDIDVAVLGMHIYNKLLEMKVLRQNG
ncbi:hypothetical protein STSP2_01402 [Anaerohalosphaera lusitana]|uniref:Uncharacterized protein n=1 Tax=Anaerohalosphaera lusitana TaxID=1936003 RepID=A0A1U9NL62_9BACT|nr:hypothetical protein [Anaerohalosphaera lusitana]AQT68246.1 hypothetical protein STSP2_01402 [Anaerohalosphaera lusitana]